MPPSPDTASPPPAAGQAGLWLALRLMTGSFLVWGVWDNVVSPTRMAEFTGFLAQYGFFAPQWLAPLSVYAQLACGLAFISGAWLRVFGAICAFNFVVALVMVDLQGGLRAAFPSGLLVLIGLLLMAGAGNRYTLPGAWRRWRASSSL